MQLTKQERRNRTIKKTFLGVLGIALVSFIGTKLYPLIHGPDIELATMTDGAHLTEPMIRVSGIAKFTKDLVVNGAPLATAPDGSFDENLLLNPGYNVITMEGKDRFGNKNVKNYSVILTEEPDHTFTLNTLPAHINQVAN
jgi:hypothetical protein